MFAKVFRCFIQVFQRHVASVCFKCSAVSDICCKCLSECCSVYTHMLQAYVPNVSSILDVCCSKSFMLQVFHEAQAVPTGRASAVGGHSRASKRRCAAWHGLAAGPGQATTAERAGRTCMLSCTSMWGATRGSPTWDPS
jgi:hypothetical protein